MDEQRYRHNHEGRYALGIDLSNLCEGNLDRLPLSVRSSTWRRRFAHRHIELENMSTGITARKSSVIYCLFSVGEGQLPNRKQILAPIIHATRREGLGRNLFLQSPDDIHVGSDGEGLL